MGSAVRENGPMKRYLNGGISARTAGRNPASVGERMTGPGKNQVIGTDVQIGEDTVVWHFVNLFGCTIGSHCKIGSYCEIGKGVVVGDYVKIEAKAYIPSGVTIEDYAFIGPGVTFTNDLYPRSAAFSEGSPALKEGFDLQRTRVRKGAAIGAGCVILPGVTIGKGAIVGAGSVICKDVPDYAVMKGKAAMVDGTVPDRKEYEDFL